MLPESKCVHKAGLHFSTRKMVKTQTYDKQETKTYESYVKANATNDSIIQKPELRRQ